MLVGEESHAYVCGGDEPHTHVHRGRSLLSRLLGGASFLGSGGISLGTRLSVIILVYTTANQSE